MGAENTPQAQAQVERMLQSIAALQGLLDSLETDLKGVEEVWRSDVDGVVKWAVHLQTQATIYMGDG